jgi:hypothetical protein
MTVVYDIKYRQSTRIVPIELVSSDKKSQPLVPDGPPMSPFRASGLSCGLVADTTTWPACHDTRLTRMGLNGADYGCDSRMATRSIRFWWTA